MKNIFIQKHKIFAIIFIVSVLCLIAISHITTLQDEKIPTLYIPAVGGSILDNTQVYNLDSIESDINSTSQTLCVYRMKPVNLSQEKEKIQNMFDVSSADIGAFPTGNTLTDGTTIGIDPQTGRWFYQKPIDFEATGGALSDKEAIQIAENFIADNNLYSLESLGEAKLGVTSTGDATQGTEEILRKNVYFYPQIDGKPVYGTFRICISISPNGEVIGVDKFVNELQLVDVPIEGKKFNDVVTALDEKDYVLNSEIAPNSISIDSISDAFYADPESEYIQPIYVLEGTDESASKEYSIWMDARAN